MHITTVIPSLVCHSQTNNLGFGSVVNYKCIYNKSKSCTFKDKKKKILGKILYSLFLFILLLVLTDLMYYWLRYTQCCG